MPTAHVFEHLPHEGPGVFADVLRERGWAVDVYPVSVAGVDAAAAEAADLLVIMGGPCGAYEGDLYPYLLAETEVIRARLAADRPTLGVCLGAQLLAQAMGARVFRGPAPEIGWHGVTLSPAGRASPLAALEGVPILHWHSDSFDLPDGAELLASTPAYAHQAFRRGARILGLQCHPEADGRGFEHWLIGQEAGLRRHGLSVTGLRAQAAAHGPAAGAAGARMLSAWLEPL